MSTSNTAKIIVALDFTEPAAALAFVDELSTYQCKLKVGKELFTRAGPELIERLVARGFDVFLDLKFHDIPATVAGAVKAAADLGVWMVNVHCLGGARMLQAASDALVQVGSRTLLTGVTVLTSMSRRDLDEVGIHQSPQEMVKMLASLASENGLDGIVCSGQEVPIIKQTIRADFLCVTPGIRPLLDPPKADDQRRVMTPAEALRAGSDYLVVGRPITCAADPLTALLAIKNEIGEDNRRD